MNYLSLLSGLCKEAFDLKQYKQLGPVFGSIAFVAVLPFVVSALSVMLSFVVLGFVYNALESSVKFLEAWLDSQKKGVRHATEAVIYFVAMPWIFFCMALLSSFAMIFYFLWFSLQVFMYIATLGGISWQPFITYSNFNAKKSWRVTTNSLASIIIVISLLILLVAGIVLAVIGEEEWNYDLLRVGFIIEAVYFACAYIGVPIIFRKKLISEGDAESDASADASDSVDDGDGIGDYIPEI